MSHQTVKPGMTLAQVKETFKLPEEAQVLMSGGQFENFRRGWAREVMADSNSAHWFERTDFREAKALCTYEAPVRWLYGPGNYPRCGNCVRIMSRMIRQGLFTTLTNPPKGGTP